MKTLICAGILIALSGTALGQSATVQSPTATNRTLTDLDADRNGEISSKEFEAYKDSPMSFDELDEDRNGRVSAQEYRGLNSSRLQNERPMTGDRDTMSTPAPRPEATRQPNPTTKPESAKGY